MKEMESLSDMLPLLCLHSTGTVSVVEIIIVFVECTSLTPTNYS